jgi:WD repeat-containing protein 68
LIFVLDDFYLNILNVFDFFSHHFHQKISSNTNENDSKLWTYTHTCPIYSLDWDWKLPNTGRIVFSTYVEGMNNKINILKLDENTKSLKLTHSADHGYPPTKVMWAPTTKPEFPDLIASTGDSLRIWEVSEDGIKTKCTLNSVYFS